ARRELLGAWQHVRQVAVGIGELVDVEEHGARYVAGLIFDAAILALRRQVPAAVDDAQIRCLQMLGQPLRADEALGMGVGHAPTKARLMRRFWRPLFSIFVTSTRPISPVRATWVPPQGCRSVPSMSSSRTRPWPLGGFTDMVRTRSGVAASSSSVIQRGRTG